MPFLGVDQDPSISKMTALIITQMPGWPDRKSVQRVTSPVSPDIAPRGAAAHARAGRGTRCNRLACIDVAGHVVAAEPVAPEGVEPDARRLPYRIGSGSTSLWRV